MAKKVNEVSIKQLISAADEMCEVMLIDETPEPESSEETLKEWLQAAGDLYDPEKDTFSEETMDILDKAGITLNAGEPKGDEPPEDETLLDQLDAEDDMRELKAMVKANDEFKSLRSSITKYKAGQEEDLKEAMFVLLQPDDEPKEETTPAKKVPAKKEPAAKAPAKKVPVKKTPAKKSEPKYIRVDSLCEVLKDNEPGTFDEWVEAADDLYAEKGGKSNLKECRFAANSVAGTLTHFKIDVPG